MNTNIQDLRDKDEQLLVTLINYFARIKIFTCTEKKYVLSKYTTVLKIHFCLGSKRFFFFFTFVQQKHVKLFKSVSKD